MPPPILKSGIEGLDIVPCAPEEQRFFRLFPEKSSKLREALDLLPPNYDWILMDVPNQFDNVAELGLIAADFLLLPVELTADCVERVQTGLRIIREARAFNPRLTVLGALALASMPRGGQPMGLTAKERLILREYKEAFKPEGIRLFHTIMFRSSTTVEEARSNADDRLLHWTARRRFRQLVAEIHARITARTLSRSPVPHAKQNGKTQRRRSSAPAHACPESCTHAAATRISRGAGRHRTSFDLGTGEEWPAAGTARGDHRPAGQLPFSMAGGPRPSLA
ncbi:MAG: ParA family protein [Gemmataceae bacterium]|nr:ParA family protein [Gemmataceae bacterium]